MTYPFGGIDTNDQPLIDAWWTRGWTNQNLAYIPAPTPNAFPGAPPATRVNITHAYYDQDGSPLTGFLTFMPTSSASLTVSGVTWRLPARLSGTTTISPVQSGWGWLQGDSGRMYLRRGMLYVTLMATDISGLVTDSGSPMTYQVIEHFDGGRKFLISVPSASDSPADLDSLIVPGSVTPYIYDPTNVMADEMSSGTSAASALSTDSIPFGSTEYVNVNVSLAVPGIGDESPLADLVYLAFMTTSATPQSGDWHAATWTTSSAPYVASVLVGPDNGGLDLAQGYYYVWLKLVDTPQVPFILAGTLVIS